MIKNESGDIKVIDKLGNVKWFSEYVIKDSRLMKDRGFTIVEAPLNIAPLKVESTEAESAPAKSSRKKIKE